MRRVMVLITLLSLTLLSGCFLIRDPDSLKEIDGVFFGEYQAYYHRNGDCENLVRILIYEDEIAKYYLETHGCEEDEDYFFVLDDGIEVPIKDAIDQGFFTIDDVIKADYGIYDFGLKSEPILNEDYEYEYYGNGVFLTVIEGYDIHMFYDGPCDAALFEPYFYQGYTFDLHWNGCELTFSGIGYQASKDGDYFEIEDLIEEKVLTARQIYEAYLHYRKALQYTAEPYNQSLNVDIDGYEVFEIIYPSCTDPHKKRILRNDSFDIFLTFNGCNGNSYYLLIGDELVNLERALELEVIRIADITMSDFSNVEVIDKTVNPNECGEWVPFEDRNLGKINGYQMRITQYTCEMVVGDITVDGYYFGYISAGCANNIDNIGLYAYKDGQSYFLQDLIDDGEMTVEEIYEFYMCTELAQSRFTE